MKPGVYTQIYIQLVFAVKDKEVVLHKDIRKRVFEYLSGILTNLKHKSIIVNGVGNHVHIFFGMNPAVSISDTVHDLKRSSSLFINDKKLCKGKFSWQEGYGAFSYSRSSLSNVCRYVESQESHHMKKTFREEYFEFLKEYEVEYEERFLFDFFDEIV